MNNKINSRIISIILLSSLAVSNGCGKETKVVEVATEPTVEATVSPNTFEGDIRSIIEQKTILRETKVYENLSVTGKRLGNMDIYIDKEHDKYVVICGQSLVYLPIDKDGVVKLNDGVYKYWKESRSTFNYVLVGDKALELSAKGFIGESSTTTGSAVKVYIDNYLCESVMAKRSEKQGNIVIDLKSLCDVIGIIYSYNEGVVELSALNGEFIIKIDEKSNIIYEDSFISCKEISNVNGNCVVGPEFLEGVLGISVFEEDNNIILSGELIPEVILLENYTATGAEDRPYSGERNGISILKMFGDYDQSSDIEDGKISYQVFYK